MKVAIVGSRSLFRDISEYIPPEAAEIISGGASGIDSAAESYADKMNIPKRIFLPEYEKYGKSAPLVRNRNIVDAADLVIAVWDGKSRGTKYVIEYALKKGTPVKVYMV